MSSMPNPLEFLFSFQQALNNGMPVHQLDHEYVKLEDKCDGHKRYSYAKFISGEVQALATFRNERPINGIACFSINYSVNENHRGRGLSVEAVNKGVDDLRKHFKNSNLKSFYIDAFIDLENFASLKVAEKIFACIGIERMDDFAGTPAIYFKRLIET